MENKEEGSNREERDYNTISPSALSLLLMKGYTDIPYARQVATLMSSPESYHPDYTKKDLTFWGRMVHFENRYWSIDQLLKDALVKNILEISSGYSFRGLAMAKQYDCHYIDTDLPEVIEHKKTMLPDLTGHNQGNIGKLELLPLNALDESQFNEIISRFPPGEITIINEGLLMYLNPEEKDKLCGLIFRTLRERGGCWITADIYIKNRMDKLPLKIDAKTQAFFDQHRIEENKFENFEEARSYFENIGFVIDDEAKTDRSKLTSMKYLLKNSSLLQLFKMRKGVKMQATWRLKPKT